MEPLQPHREAGGTGAPIPRGWALLALLLPPGRGTTCAQLVTLRSRRRRGRGWGATPVRGESTPIWCCCWPGSWWHTLTDRPALRPAPHPPALPAAVRRQPSEAGGQRCPPAGQRPGHGGSRQDRWRASSAPAWSWGRAPGGHSPGGASVPGGLCLVPPGPAPGRPAAAGRAGTSGRPAGLGAAESGLRRAAGQGRRGRASPCATTRAGPSGRALRRTPGERHGRAGQLQRGRHEPHPAPAPGGGRAVGGAGGQAQCGAGGVGELL
ncbi:MAG: hypothetical protein ACLRWQ_19635 [Flavonifractor plautii]